jgi:hypothetical protein
VSLCLSLSLSLSLSLLTHSPPTRSPNYLLAHSQGSIWSEEFSINMVSSPHRGSFEIIDWESMRAYQLSYSMKYMPGLFSSTQLLTITPRYCIVNCLEEEIMVVQRGSRDILEIFPYQAEGWHKSKASLGTSVQIRSGSSVWSMGSVDLNEVGQAFNLSFFLLFLHLRSPSLIFLSLIVTLTLTPTQTLTLTLILTLILILILTLILTLTLIQTLILTPTGWQKRHPPPTTISPRNHITTLNYACGGQNSRAIRELFGCSISMASEYSEQYGPGHT